MIATHDSLTCLPPRHRWMRLLSPWWRTQGRTVERQLADGVRYFDIRLRYDGGDGIRFCHGIVDFEQGAACAAVQGILSREGVRYRIVLERGGARDEARFRHDVDRLLASGMLPGLDVAVIKRGWQVAYASPRRVPSVRDLTRPALRSDRPWWKQPLGLLRALVPVHRWASRHNPAHAIPPEAAATEAAAYFLDFYELAPCL